MLKNLWRTIKAHWIKLASFLLLGILIGGGVIYSIEENEKEFWREKYMEQTASNDSLRLQMEQLHKENELLTQKNQDLKDDLGITILSSIRSNFYDLKALKSENYNTQIHYNNEAHKSNLVPKKIGEKWDLNIFSDRYNKELARLMDTIAKREERNTN
ncbi:MAG: hypothetical protein K9H65_04000 [Bacteroidales bacterium]|nr:hypothetical protein [Bacteroidales bacterium]